MHIQNKSFIDGSREPLSAVGGRPVHVINAVLRVAERAASAHCKPVRGAYQWKAGNS
jgi:hypothetical protein